MGSFSGFLGGIKLGNTERIVYTAPPRSQVIITTLTVSNVSANLYLRISPAGDPSGGVYLAENWTMTNVPATWSNLRLSAGQSIWARCTGGNYVGVFGTVVTGGS